MKKDLTNGSLAGAIVSFSLPYLLSYFLQTLYGMADLFIAGQFNGANVISAVGIGSQVMGFMTAVIVGLAMGTTILISRAVGANDNKSVSRFAGNTVTFFCGMSIAFMLLFLLLCPCIVSIMAVPQEAVRETKIYLTVCFSGIPFITAYNVIAAVFRSTGDSKSPLYFIAAACCANIIADYVFCGIFGLGAGGVALSTVISQGLSVFISLIAARKLKIISIKKADLKPRKAILLSLLRIGVPVACQDGFIQVSFLLITVIANKRGVEVSAAVSIVEKIMSFLFLIPSAMNSTVATVASQNIGAKKFKRAKKTLLYALGMSVSLSAILCALFEFFAVDFISLFTREEKVVALGVQYLRSYLFDVVLGSVQFSFSGYFCACGKSFLSFAHNVASVLLVRVPGAYVATKLWSETLFPMGLAAPAGSLLSSILCLIFFAALEKKSESDFKI